MSDFATEAKKFHRKSPLQSHDADFSKSDKKQASEKLKEATSKGETLNEWFNKKKKGSKDCGSTDPDLIPVSDGMLANKTGKAAEEEFEKRVKEYMRKHKVNREEAEAEVEEMF